ncbi:MAG: Transcriptional regulator [Stygiobacter sp.]|nr:MAG: Transcriptional regulator [Stygiobacter sp.]
MADDDISPLTAHLGYWLRYVSNHVSHAFAGKLEARGVTVAEWVLLREIHDHRSIAPSRLADRLGLTRGAVSKLAERLIDKGLLGREACPVDGRAHSLALTADGRTLVPELAGLADANDAEFFGDLTPDDRATLERVLKSVIDGRGLKAPPLQ